MPDYITVCEQAARAGGAVLQDWAGRFNVREKGPADLVTEADLASQEAVRSIVLGAFPDHGFLGEEDQGAPQANRGWKTASSFRWIVDPLDGTSNYVHGVPHYSVSVALEGHGELLAGAVFDPVADECYTAAAGKGAYMNGFRLRASPVKQLSQALVAASLPAQVTRDSEDIRALVEVMLTAQAIRRMGSAALNLSYLAAGRFDGFWATDTKAWDVAAGFLLVREAGGVIEALDGGPVHVDQPRCLAAATPELLAELRGVLLKALAR